MALKRLNDGEELPDDFWNYDVNVILGYSYRVPRNYEVETKKYAMKPNGDLK